ncbi:iron chaperone [Nocardia sp. NPDC088792]|uniref:iron chaperone n=1 Tax=Nocardia sp. NPDC088792 TaxID=3364332 RepID=UPI003814117C
MATATSVAEYVTGFPAETQAVLEHVRSAVRTAVPGSTETISYDIPAVQVNGKAVMYFAGWKKHISVYPVPVGDSAYAQAIAPYVAGKGTLKFPLKDPIPFDLIGRTAALLASERAQG